MVCLLLMIWLSSIFVNRGTDLGFLAGFKRYVPSAFLSYWEKPSGSTTGFAGSLISKWVVGGFSFEFSEEGAQPMRRILKGFKRFFGFFGIEEICPFFMKIYKKFLGNYEL